MNGVFSALMVEGRQIGGLLNWTLDTQIIGDKLHWSLKAEQYWAKESATTDEVWLLVGDDIWTCKSKAKVSKTDGMQSRFALEGSGPLVPKAKVP